MKKRMLLLIALLITAISLFSVYWERNRLLKLGLESLLNGSSRELFSGSLRLSAAEFQPGLRIRAAGLSGKLKTKEGAVSFRVSEILTLNALTKLLSPEGLKLSFLELKPVPSESEGADGKLAIRLGQERFTEIKAEIRGLRLEDMQWINPDNLSGSSGRLAGVFFMRTEANGHCDFNLKLRVKEPGGKIQARFFDFFKPYLPQMASSRIQELSSSIRLLPYQNADLTMTLAAADKMKVFLHILIPDYNLNLNLNMEIRTDEGNAFAQAAQVLGLIQIEKPKR